MKYKFLMPIFLSIVVGLSLGKIFFDNYSINSVPVFNDKNTIYMLQVGVYSSLSKMKKNFKNYNKYLYILEDDGYHLYIGITKNKKNVSKIKEFYRENGYSIYVKDFFISNASFLSILNEYDKIIDITSGDSIDEIEKIVISNYKEMVLENEN